MFSMMPQRWRKRMHAYIVELASNKRATFNGMPKGARKEKLESNSQMKWSKPHRRLMSWPCIQKKILFYGNPLCGSNEKVKGGEFIFIPPMCGHGGERWIANTPVDRYAPGTRTVFQYHGYYWHGCLHSHPNARDKIIGRNRSSGGSIITRTREHCFQPTVKRTAALRTVGFTLIER